MGDDAPWMGANRSSKTRTLPGSDDIDRFIGLPNVLSSTQRLHVARSISSSLRLLLLRRKAKDWWTLQLETSTVPVEENIDSPPECTNLDLPPQQNAGTPKGASGATTSSAPKKTATGNLCGRGQPMDIDAIKSGNCFRWEKGHISKNCPLQSWNKGKKQEVRASTTEPSTGSKIEELMYRTRRIQYYSLKEFKPDCKESHNRRRGSKGAESPNTKDQRFATLEQSVTRVVYAGKPNRRKTDGTWAKLKHAPCEVSSNEQAAPTERSPIATIDVEFDRMRPGDKRGHSQNKVAATDADACGPSPKRKSPLMEKEAERPIGNDTSVSRVGRQRSTRPRRAPQEWLKPFETDQKTASPIPVYNADGSRNKAGEITTYAELRLKIGGHSERIDLAVTDLGSKEIFLGHDWLVRHNPSINWATGSVTFTRCQCAGNRFVLPDADPDDEWELEEGETILAIDFEEAIEIRAVHKANELAAKANEEKEKKTFEQMVPESYRDFKDLFSKENFDDLPVRKPWDHAIELVPNAKNTLDCKDESNHPNPHGLPFFFVKKKDGTLRPVQDYRKLNEMTIKNRYPLPLISELMDKLGSAKYFTKLDVRWGYNNVRIKKDDEWKCIQNKRGLFEPTVMFFGLTNSPATFQWMMNDIFKDLIATGKITVYLDDILIFSKTLEEHRKTTRHVLALLRKHKLFLKAENASSRY
ncbi:uncharacterized protein ARMOST_03419 [Armillaria ostoyae]|uniref:Reverse transcriptase domain-containing protein n=1 Tax=Armillaria ostoyae TaxID=47428 RepID=A0A284QUI1_ARMOS|nr:uncharacterized protein ARMOST_03419 [Armillaria ostoyae]